MILLRMNALVAYVKQVLNFANPTWDALLVEVYVALSLFQEVFGWTPENAQKAKLQVIIIILNTEENGSSLVICSSFLMN